MAAALPSLLAALLLAQPAPLQDASPQQASPPALDLLSPEEFGTRLQRLKELAVGKSFKPLHGDHVRSTTWAVNDSWGTQLPNPDKFGDDDEAMRRGYCTYGGSFGTVYLPLLEGELRGAEAARAMRMRLEALEQVFRDTMSPWELERPDAIASSQPWTVHLQAMPQISDWGPSIQFMWWLEPIPAAEGEVRFEVRARVVGLATPPEAPLPTASSDPAIPSVWMAGNSNQPLDRAAQQFVEALRRADVGGFEGLVYSAPEFRHLELRRFAAEDVEYESEEERLTIFQEVREEITLGFRYLAESLRDSYPVVDLEQLRLVKITSATDRRAALADDEDSWTEADWDFVDDYDDLYGEFYDQVLILTLAAHYPGSDPILFDLELVLMNVESRYAVAAVGEEVHRVRSMGLDAATQELARFLFGGETEGFLDAIFPTHIDQLVPLAPGAMEALDWWWMHRCPLEDEDATEPADFAWGNPQQWRRLHLARAELEELGWDHPASWELLGVEVLPGYTTGATEQLWVTGLLKKEDGTSLRARFQLELMHHGKKFSIHPDGRFELQVLPEPPALSAAGVAARQLASDLRRANLAGNLDKSLELEAALLEGVDELEPRQQAAVWRGLASARVQRYLKAEEQGDAAAQLPGVLQAAQEFDRAFLMLQALRGKTEWDHSGSGIALGSVETAQELTAIVRICVNAARDLPDRAAQLPYYEAAARAGSWLSIATPALRTAAMQTAQVSVDALQNEGKQDEAFDLLRRYFPLDWETRDGGLAKHAERWGIPIASVVSGYRTLAVLRYNRAVGMYQRAMESERPRPGLAWQAVQEAWKASEAVRFSNRAAPEIAADQALLADIRKLHETLSEAALSVSF